MNKFCVDSRWEQLDTMLFLIHTQKIKLLCSFMARHYNLKSKS